MPFSLNWSMIDIITPLDTTIISDIPNDVNIEETKNNVSPNIIAYSLDFLFILVIIVFIIILNNLAHVFYLTLKYKYLLFKPQHIPSIIFLVISKILYKFIDSFFL